MLPKQLNGRPMRRYLESIVRCSASGPSKAPLRQGLASYCASPAAARIGPLGDTQSLVSVSASVLICGRGSDIPTPIPAARPTHKVMALKRFMGSLRRFCNPSRQPSLDTALSGQRLYSRQVPRCSVGAAQWPQAQPQGQLAAWPLFRGSEGQAAGGACDAVGSPGSDQGRRSPPRQRISRSWAAGSGQPRPPWLGTGTRPTR
jgi:hypothetical protein